MKFKRLTIENIRSYRELDLEFKDGVTVISGVNGSGKSSILEACFMGLFGEKALDGTPLQIDDMIRKGSSKASIIIDFEHAGDDYQIERQFRLQKSGRANNPKSVLKKNGAIIAEQAKGTYDVLKKLLKMDEKNFQNCSYIRQGDVDALINAKPKDRQQMIDDLLQLGKLEEYRERAQESKKAVNRVLRQENEKQDETQKKIKELSGKNLCDELNRRREAISKINALLGKKRTEKDLIAENLTLLEAKIREIEDGKKETDRLRTEVLGLGKKRDTEISKKEETLREIIAAEKKEKELSEEANRIRKELNASKEVTVTKELPDMTENGIDLFINAAGDAEKKAAEAEYEISKQAALIENNRKTIEKEMASKEKEAKFLKENAQAVEKQAEKHAAEIDKTSAAVEAGFMKAGMEKASFLSLFDELFKAFKDGAKGENTIENTANAAEEAEETEAEAIDIQNIAFYSSVVKAEELPLPSDEKSWKDLIGDIERLEEFIDAGVTEENGRLTEEERKRASIKGELEEKGKSIEDIEKEIRRLTVEKKKTEENLKLEQDESEKKKKLI